MRKTIALPAVLLAACAETPSYAPLQPLPTSPVAYDTLDHAGAAPIVIAIGGTLDIAIPDPGSIGVSGDASPGFEVEPHDGAWPNMKVPDYAIRALGPGTGTFSIATDHGIASGTVEAAEVERVAIARTSLGAGGHLIVELALYDAAGRSLVDGTLHLADDQPGATQTAWNQLAIAATGAHTLHVTGDSIPEQTFTIGR
ncbi:MAG TPA: hypothetical protein VLX92_16940 [Kofleriaceae bacterium]|nr:hypothetical protein [Kofleriaceae bacterium]